MNIADEYWGKQMNIADEYCRRILGKADEYWGKQMNIEESR